MAHARVPVTPAGARAAPWPLALLVLALAAAGVHVTAWAGDAGATGTWRPLDSIAAAANPQTPQRSPSGARPVAVELPDIGVSATVEAVDLRGDGTLDTPAADTVGWYARTPIPGAPGSSVLAAHRDSTSAPGVFADLPALEAGSLVGVRGRDGAVTVFVVNGRSRHPKQALPAALWEPSAERLLHLVTCGGPFARGSYRDNVIVHAEAVGTWWPAPGQASASPPWETIAASLGASSN